jgi:flagellar hook-length control protein FliK
MPVGLPVAPQMQAVLLPLPAAAARVVLPATGTMQIALPGFGDELDKALAIPGPEGQPLPQMPTQQPKPAATAAPAQAMPQLPSAAPTASIAISLVQPLLALQPPATPQPQPDPLQPPRPTPQPSRPVTCKPASDPQPEVQPLLVQPPPLPPQQSPPPSLSVTCEPASDLQPEVQPPLVPEPEPTLQPLRVLQPPPNETLPARPRAATTTPVRHDTTSRDPAPSETSASPVPEPPPALAQMLPMAAPPTDSAPASAPPVPADERIDVPIAEKLTPDRPGPPQSAARPAELKPAPADPTVPIAHDTPDAAPVAASSPPTPVAPTEVAPRALPVTEPTTTSSPPSVLPPTPAASAAPSPVAQMAPVLVSLAHAPDGAQRITMRLEPPELGRVEIRIERPTDAPARVEITVQRTETLTLLLRDQPQLQRALDQAGVPPEGRTVTFHVAAPEPAPRAEPAAMQSPAIAAGGLSGDGSHGPSRQNGEPRQTSGDAPDGIENDAVPMAPPAWMRAGLDITA